jgi:hypothetical protein
MDVPTYTSIERWYRQIFLKICWVVLHLELGDKSGRKAVEKYLDSMGNFIEAAKKKGNGGSDIPNYMQNELRKMIHDVETLRKHMSKDAGVAKAKRKTKK